MLEEEPTTLSAEALSLWKHNEFLAHRLPVKLQRAYDKKQLPETISLLDSDGVEREYTPQKVEGLHAGIVCFILKPTANDNARVHVVFRGTHNLKGVQRDLKINSPGSRSLAKYSTQILAAIEEAVVAVKETNINGDKAILTMGGHSLGGADAKNHTCRLLKEVALNPESPLATSIGTINIIHKNAPGISAKAAAVAKASVEAIKGNKKTANITINYFPIIIARDFVQKAGYTSLFSDIGSDQVNTTLLKADLGKNAKVSYWALLFDGPITWYKNIYKNIVAIHKFKIFDELNDSTKVVNAAAKIEVYTNATPEGKLQIQQELDNKTLKNIYKKITDNLPKPKTLINKLNRSKRTVVPNAVSSETSTNKLRNKD